ncbi:MAG: hypothetical protein ABI435_04225 [Pseudolysinimonas sp.]
MAGVLLLHSDSDKWLDAPFERIKRVSNTRVGAVGQDFMENYAASLGVECIFPLNAAGKRATQSPWDIQLDGIKFELKTASEDVSGNFQFNHIRLHRVYDAVLCLGIAPATLYFGMWTKADIATGKAGSIVSMEKGANASYKLTKRSANLSPISEFRDTFTDFHSDWKP